MLIVPNMHGDSGFNPLRSYHELLNYIRKFDKNGNTGGCQATYTVIPATTAPTCANVTFPPLLSVNAQVDNGPMSQYGWIDQVSYFDLPAFAYLTLFQSAVIFPLLRRMGLLHIPLQYAFDFHNLLLIDWEILPSTDCSCSTSSIQYYWPWYEKHQLDGCLVMGNAILSECCWFSW